MRRQQNFGKLVTISLLFHLCILTILVVSIEFNSKNFVLENSKEDIVNAIILDEAKIQKASPIPVTAKMQSTPKKELTPIVKQTKSEPIKPQEVKKEFQKSIQKNVIAIPDKKKKLQKELIEKQLLAEIKQAQKNKKQKDLEKAMQKEIKAAQVAAKLQQQLRDEQNQLSSASAQKMRGVVDKYKALILQAIAQHWLVPNGVDKSLSSQLLIRLSAKGTVLDVQLVKSSGDDALDRSARLAVFKASPLPVPEDASEFALFKEFILKVKPENVLGRDNDF